jgi:hypothetical protein
MNEYQRFSLTDLHVSQVYAIDFSVLRVVHICSSLSYIPVAGVNPFNNLNQGGQVHQDEEGHDKGREQAQGKER